MCGEHALPSELMAEARSDPTRNFPESGLASPKSVRESAV